MADASDPLQTLTVGVSDRATERWLRLALAAEWGVCANLECELPGSLIWRLIRGLLDDVGANPSWEVPALSLRVLRLLESEAPPELEAYWAGASPLGRYGLSRRLARTYDRYLVFRPEWIREWERGEGAGDWQAELWRRLRADTEQPHWVGLADAVNAALADPVAADRLPAATHLVGAASLSPAYIQLLGAIGRHVDVHVYALSPTPEFIGDEMSAARLARMAIEDPSAADYLAVGHPLVGSWGRGLIDAVDALAAAGADDRPHFQTPASRGSLASVQRQLLSVATQSPRPDGLATLQVHSAPSPLRELEVVRDQLLNLFEQHPDLHPEQVVIAAPNVADYRFFLEAALSGAGDPRDPDIPYSVADHGLLADPAMRAFKAVVDVLAGPLSAPAVVGLLDYPDLRHAAGLDEVDAGEITRWIRGAGIRWGADANDLRARGLEELTDRHTWRRGAATLLLGYAMDPHRSPIFDELSVFEPFESGDANRLGSLLEFVDGLIAAQQETAKSRPATEWSRRVGHWVERFFGATPTIPTDNVQGAAAAAAERAAVAGYRDDVPWSVFWEWMQEERARRGAAILQRGVTVCDLASARAGGFRVAFVLGLNDGEFPPAEPTVEFDRTADSRRPGDRSARDDARLHLLELLVATPLHLHLSFVGVDQRTGQPLAPSLLVDELLAAAGDALRVVQHPLQPDSARYDDGDSGLFTYRPVGPTPWTATAWPRTESIPEPVVDLADLVNFCSDPASAFLREQLGARLYRRNDALPEVESWRLNSLDDWQLRNDILSAVAAGLTADDALAQCVAAGRLPPPPAAAMLGGKVRREIQEAAEAVTHLLGDPRDPLVVDLQVGESRLVGSLSGMRAQGRADVQAARAKMRNLVATWIRHLVACAVGAEGHSVRYVSRDRAAFHWRNIPQPASLLQHWVEAYRLGREQLLGQEPERAVAWLKEERGLKPPSNLQAGTTSAVPRWDLLARHFGEEALHDPEWTERLLLPMFKALTTS